MNLLNRIKEAFTPHDRPPDIEQVAQERAESSAKVDRMMGELISASERSIRDQKDIRRGIMDVKRRIQGDPFLIVGGRDDS